MVVLITDNKPFGGGNSCQHRPRDSWWVIRVFFLEGWHNQIHHLMRITLALSQTDLSLLALRLSHWRSLETVMPSTLWLFPHPWWLSMKYYSHFHSQKVLVKNSLSSSNSHSLFQKKSWCISTNCHLKSAFIDRLCPAVLLTARTLPPRSTLWRVLHLSISSTPKLKKKMIEKWLEYLSSFSTGPYSDPCCMTHGEPLIIVERRNL